MLKITDRTLSCLDDFSPSAKHIKRLIELLIQCDADCIELSVKSYEILGALPSFGSYLLRIDTPEEADQYREFDKFICKRHCDENRHVYAEIMVNDVRDRSLIVQHRTDKMLRITGLADLFRQSVAATMEFLSGVIPINTEFCPDNSLECGCGAAAEWINAGCSGMIVTSFAGIGGFTPFEAMLISARQFFRRHPQTNYEYLPEIRNIIADITGQSFTQSEPVIGNGIFTVESGIHIDGILKHPKCYEPFPPESVGGKREFTYGKFSGRSGVKYKLSKMNISVTEKELELITQRIKSEYLVSNRSVDDNELIEIATEVKSLLQ